MATRSSQKMKRGNDSTGRSSTSSSMKENRSNSTAEASVIAKPEAESSKKPRLALSPLSEKETGKRSSAPGEQPAVVNSTATSSTKARPGNKISCDGEGSVTPLATRRNNSKAPQASAPDLSVKKRVKNNAEGSGSQPTSSTPSQLDLKLVPAPAAASGSSSSGQGTRTVKAWEKPTFSSKDKLARTSSERNWRLRDNEGGPWRANNSQIRPRGEQGRRNNFEAAVNVKPFVPMALRSRSTYLTDQPQSPFSGSDGFAASSPLDIYYSDTGSSLPSGNRNKEENVFNFSYHDISDHMDTLSSSLGHMSLDQSGYYGHPSDGLPRDFLPSVPPPAMQQLSQNQFTSGFPAYVDEQGFISLQLREKVTLDISVNLGIRLRNSVQQTTLALSGCGTQVALVHPKGCVLQYGSRIEVQCKDEISVKNAKMYPRGVSFTANNCALVYLLDQAGARTTSEMFHDLHENNVASALFEQSCDMAPWAVAQNISRLEEAVYWRSDSNVDCWIISGISVQQTRDGLTIVERIIGSDRFVLKASPSNGKVRLETGFMQVTASLGDESHLFVRSQDRRLHYNGRNLVFTVRNAGHAAGFDEGGVLRIF